MENCECETIFLLPLFLVTFFIVVLQASTRILIIYLRGTIMLRPDLANINYLKKSLFIIYTFLLLLQFFFYLRCLPTLLVL